MAQRRSEVLPERRIHAWIVGREQQRQHEHQSGDAGRAHQYAAHQRDAYQQFTISYQKRDRRGMRQYESLEQTGHERVSAMLDEAVDPHLESAVQSELRAKNLVLPENQKEH